MTAVASFWGDVASKYFMMASLIPCNCNIVKDLVLVIAQIDPAHLVRNVNSDLQCYLLPLWRWECSKMGHIKGNPFGVGRRMTFGILKTKAREKGIDLQSNGRCGKGQSQILCKLHLRCE